MKVSTVTDPAPPRCSTAPQPEAGPNDVLVPDAGLRHLRVPNAFYITIGGIPPRQGCTPLGHEPAGELVEVGAEVSGLAVGDHVVINPMAAPSGIIGNGGASGALADYLLIENSVRGVGLEVIPDHIPWEVAALNEPMAVAANGANRSKAKPGRQGGRVRRRAPSGWARCWRSSRLRRPRWWFLVSSRMTRIDPTDGELMPS